MEYEITRAETIVTLKMTEKEFNVLYEHFPSQHDRNATASAKEIDKFLGQVADEL